MFKKGDIVEAVYTENSLFVKILYIASYSGDMWHVEDKDKVQYAVNVQNPNFLYFRSVDLRAVCPVCNTRCDGTESGKYICRECFNIDSRPITCDFYWQSIGW